MLLDISIIKTNSQDEQKKTIILSQIHIMYNMNQVRNLSVFE